MNNAFNTTEGHHACKHITTSSICEPRKQASSLFVCPDLPSNSGADLVEIIQRQRHDGGVTIVEYELELEHGLTARLPIDPEALQATTGPPNAGADYTFGRRPLCSNTFGERMPSAHVVRPGICFACEHVWWARVTDGTE